jgi:hypothetical protein
MPGCQRQRKHEQQPEHRQEELIDGADVLLLEKQIVLAHGGSYAVCAGPREAGQSGMLVVVFVDINAILQLFIVPSGNYPKNSWR